MYYRGKNFFNVVFLTYMLYFICVLILIFVCLVIKKLKKSHETQKRFM